MIIYDKFVACSDQKYILQRDNFLFMKKTMTPTLIIVAVIIFLMGLKVVSPMQARVVLRLWKTNRILREGLNWIIPFFERTRSQSLAMTNFDVKVDGITEDNVKTAVELNVIFKVKDNDKAIIDSIYIINNTTSAIRAMVEEQLRAKIFTFKHDEIFGKRTEIWDEVKQTLAQKLDEFGMALDSVQVKDIQLDSRVMDAMNSVVASEKNKLATIKNSEALKQSSILNAEAEKEVKKLIWEWMALQREAIANGFRNSIEEIKNMDKSLSWSQILEFLLASARIETLEKIGQDNAKVIYLNENLEGKMASMIQEGR